MPRLMHRPHTLPTILPQPGHHHPLPDRLTRKSNAVQFLEVLARKRRPEGRIALADDPGHFSPQNPRIGTVAWLPASARRQSSRAALPKCLRQPQHLATAKPNQCRCLRNPDPLLSQIAQYIHPIDLRTAHQNHRHRPPAPHPIRKPGRVTSLSGPTVTSLSGVYTSPSRHPSLGMKQLAQIFLGTLLSFPLGSAPAGSNSGLRLASLVRAAAILSPHTPIAAPP